MAKSIYGIHDAGAWFGAIQEGMDAWCLYTEAIGSDPNDHSGRDYSHLRITPIVRLNNGYGSGGTIPLPERYPDFARRCANFVANSHGCTRWIIGNEIALQWEWPEGQPIRLADYIACFKLCRAAIKAVQPEAEVIPQPPAPWNTMTPDAPDWIKQLHDMLNAVECDGVAIHAYSHGYDPHLITAEQTMNPPWDRYFYQFSVYKQFMAAIPENKRHLPVYLTETNGDGPWPHQNTGWVQAMYAEIDRWNQQENTQPIRCAILFRWEPGDEKWTISGAPGSLDDFRQALARGYTAPDRVIIGQPGPTPIPLPQHPPIWTGKVVAASGLNVRLAPVGEKIGAVAFDEPLTVYEERDGWLLIFNRDGLGGWVSAQFVSPTDKSDGLIEKLAADWRVDQRLVKAVLQVESGGDGFLPDGRLKIRFEVHLWREHIERQIFDAHWRVNGPNLWEGHEWKNASGMWEPVHGSLSREWRCYDYAYRFNAEGATQCISMGAPQIMGFHYARLGYASPLAMRHDFAQKYETQIVSMFRLMDMMRDHAGTSALDHLRKRDLVGFAALYNGPGMASYYAGLIEKAMR